MVVMIVLEKTQSKRWVLKSKELTDVATVQEFI